MNPILNTDSYKASHYRQYPEDVAWVSSYIEARGGKYPETVFFGLQAFLKEYLSKPFTQAHINEAEDFWEAHGLPFNRGGWEYILARYRGYMPILIQAVDEGSVVPTGNVLVQIINTDPEVPWITSYVETALLRAIWYPTTVATLSHFCKRDLYNYWKESSDAPIESLDFKLHDFGARGVSSLESAGLGGMAHLVNFKGTDTVEGVLAARRYYNEPMAGYSIPAAEHSTICSWGGPGREMDAFRNMISQFGGDYPLIAVVSDSYNIWDAVDNKWPYLDTEISASGSTIVVRPDSGDPHIVPVEVISRLMQKFGFTVNSKGYHVLPDRIRVIQGDGITGDSLNRILFNLRMKRLSIDNIAFGMGGGLLQQINRDTCKFAMKCSAVAGKSNQWQPVFKQPVDQPDKVSKKGRLNLIRNSDGEFETVPEKWEESRGVMPIRSINGLRYHTTTFEEIRGRVQEHLIA